MQGSDCYSMAAWQQCRRYLLQPCCDWWSQNVTSQEKGGFGSGVVRVECRGTKRRPEV
jgi:hypothetical protein